MGVITTKMRCCASETALARKVACGGWALCWQNSAFHKINLGQIQTPNSRCGFKAQISVKLASV